MTKQRDNKTSNNNTRSSQFSHQHYGSSAQKEDKLIPVQSGCQHSPRFNTRFCKGNEEESE